MSARCAWRVLLTDVLEVRDEVVHWAGKMVVDIMKSCQIVLKNGDKRLSVRNFHCSSIAELTRTAILATECLRC